MQILGTLLTVLIYFSFISPALAQEPPEFAQKKRDTIKSIEVQILDNPEYQRLSKKVLSRHGEDRSIVCFLQLSNLRGEIAELAVKATGSMDLDQLILALVRSSAPFKLQTIHFQEWTYCPWLLLITFEIKNGTMKISAREGHGRSHDDDFWITETTPRMN